MQLVATVKEEEWIEVGAWVFKNFDMISGISFLPYSDHSYKQAPYQECSENQYLEMMDKMPQDINWNELSIYEVEDNTRGSQEYACTGDKCEIVDLK